MNRPNGTEETKNSVGALSCTSFRRKSTKRGEGGGTKEKDLAATVPYQ